jgi:Shedu protein SduA, C-terminal
MHYVVPEFGLGKSLKYDFVLLQSFSGGWHCHFVELEPVDDRILNKDGTPSIRLRRAEKQIEDWQTNVETDRNSLKRQLADACQKTDLLHPQWRHFEPSGFCRVPLRDPRTWVYWNYDIVIGRRTVLTETNQARRNNRNASRPCEIVTYDRFIDTAENWDSQVVAMRSKKA